MLPGRTTPSTLDPSRKVSFRLGEFLAHSLRSAVTSTDPLQRNAASRSERAHGTSQNESKQMTCASQSQNGMTEGRAGQMIR